MKKIIFLVATILGMELLMSNDVVSNGAYQAEDASKYLIENRKVLSKVDVSPELKRKHEEFRSWKFGLFMHFNIATFHNVGWATGHEDPLSFTPSKLNCEQWADAAISAGMKYAVLTVKHTEGYPLWPSKTTTHSITAFSNFRDGKGDLVQEYVDAFRKKGIKVGFYYCLPGDYSAAKWSNHSPEGKFDLHGMPPETHGDPDAMQQMIEAQVTELLTQYGKIDLMWFDQIYNKYTGKHWLEVKALVGRLQPNCIVIGNCATDYKLTDIYSWEYPYLRARPGHKPGDELPPEDNVNAGEVCDTVMPKWFWDSRNKLTFEAEKAYEMLDLCNTRGANYLLNVPPDKDGVISTPSLEFLQEIGRLRGLRN